MLASLATIQEPKKTQKTLLDKYKTYLTHLLSSQRLSRAAC